MAAGQRWARAVFYLGGSSVPTGWEWFPWVLGGREVLPTDSLGEGEPLQVDQPWPWAGPRWWPRTAPGQIPSSAAAGPPYSCQVGAPPPWPPRHGAPEAAANTHRPGRAGAKQVWPPARSHPGPTRTSAPPTGLSPLTPDQPPPPRPPADPQAGRGSKSTGGCPQGQGQAVRKQQSQRLQTVHSGQSAPADGDPPRQEASSGVTAASPPHCTCGVRTPGGSGRTWPSACGPLHPGHGQGFPRVQDGQGWGWWETHRSAQPAGGPHIC